MGKKLRGGLLPYQKSIKSKARDETTKVATKKGKKYRENLSYVCPRWPTTSKEEDSATWRKGANPRWLE